MDDGRRLRRDRNRDAVVEAALDLINSGDLSPSAEAIADHAGVSSRSLFRYFDDIDDLTRAAVRRQIDRIRDVAGIDVASDAPLEERVEAVVEQRLRVIEVMGLVGKVSRMLAMQRPLVRSEVAQGRSYLRHQLEKVFASELAAMPEPEADAVLATLDVVTSFEGFHLMLEDQGLDRGQIAQVWQAMIHRLVSPAAVPATK